ncbi:MAG: hypothetical protein ACREBQ_06360 [Nitrososphaerales archaeon]
MGGKFGPQNILEDDRSLKSGRVYASWYSGGVRGINISNQYSPEGDCILHSPTLSKKKQKTVQTNDLCVDERG